MELTMHDTKVTLTMENYAVYTWDSEIKIRDWARNEATIWVLALRYLLQSRAISNHLPTPCAIVEGARFDEEKFGPQPSASTPSGMDFSSSPN
jgi:hypothetical protein